MVNNINKNKKIFLMPEEVLKINLGAFPYSSYHKQNIIKEYNMFLNYLKENNLCKTIDNANVIQESNIDDAIRGFLDTKPSSTYKNLSRSCLKIIFILHNLEFDRSKYPVTNYAEFKDIEDKIITYDEFLNELNNLFNESEKLISYMAFKGLLGKEILNARMAKVSDIDFKNGIWKLYDGRIVQLDDEVLVQLLKNTINQKEYIPYDKKEKSSENGLHFPEAYEYNPDCKYLFKTRNHPRSDYGLAPFARVGIETMFARLVHEFGSIFNRNNLKVSGFLDAMYKKDATPNWTIHRINDFKKETGYKVSSINARVFYLQKYFPSFLEDKKNKTNK